MTNTIHSLTTDIAAAQAVIDKAQPLADKLAEMQAAVAAIAEASRTLEQLRARLAEAEAASRMLADAANGWTIESIRPALGYDSGPVARHTVEASRIVHGLYGRAPVTERYALHALTPELHAAVLANADMIPVYIRVLSADPSEALRQHARHVARGYMAS